MTSCNKPDFNRLVARGGNSVQFKAFRISDKFVLILHVFFPFLINMDKHGNHHTENEKYFQNLHGKASKFLDFPQQSLNCHLPLFKDRSTHPKYIREQQA